MQSKHIFQVCKTTIFTKCLPCFSGFPTCVCPGFPILFPPKKNVQIRGAGSSSGGWEVTCNMAVFWKWGTPQNFGAKATSQSELTAGAECRKWILKITETCNNFGALIPNNYQWSLLPASSFAAPKKLIHHWLVIFHLFLQEWAIYTETFFRVCLKMGHPQFQKMTKKNQPQLAPR